MFYDDGISRPDKEGTLPFSNDYMGDGISQPDKKKLGNTPTTGADIYNGLKEVNDFWGKYGYEGYNREKERHLAATGQTAYLQGHANIFNEQAAMLKAQRESEAPYMEAIARAKVHNMGSNWGMSQVPPWLAKMEGEWNGIAPQTEQTPIMPSNYRPGMTGERETTTFPYEESLGSRIINSLIGEPLSSQTGPKILDYGTRGLKKVPEAAGAVGSFIQRYNPTTGPGSLLYNTGSRIYQALRNEEERK